MPSKIEWTEDTWNPMAGCAVVSEGCRDCYAMREAGGRLRNHPKYANLTRPSASGPVWNGRVNFWEPAVLLPLRRRKPTRFFVDSMSDLFYARVTRGQVARLFAVMAMAQQHHFIVLTKRPDRAAQLLGSPTFVQLVTNLVGAQDAGAAVRMPWPLRNVWLGVSAESQRRLDERIGHLHEAPAAVKLLSLEPLLGPLRLGEALSWIDWVIAGGESGPRARCLHPWWIEDLAAQCATWHVPFFFKQWGEWSPHPAPGKDSCWVVPTGQRMGDITRDCGKAWAAVSDAGLVKSRTELTYRSAVAQMWRVGKKAAGAEWRGGLPASFRRSPEYQHKGGST